MRIRCKHCKEIIEYNPRTIVFKRKFCKECKRWFTVSELDVVLDGRSPIRSDRNRILMKHIRDWMEASHHIVSIKEVAEAFHLHYLKARRILLKMDEYTIVKKTQTGKFALYHPYIADQCEAYDDLPVYCEWHAIKIRCEMQHKLSHSQIKTILRRLGIRFKSEIMCGNWEKIWVYPGLRDWDCIEINKKTVFLNFNGIIRTHNPRASIEDIEGHDLMAAVIFLQRIGVTVESHISDIQGHWAFVGQKLTREDQRMYEHMWSDESLGLPEIETDSPIVADEISKAIKIISKIDKYLQFRYFDRNVAEERELFYKLKDNFKNKQLDMMQYIESVQSMEIYQMFGAIYNFRARHLPITIQQELI